MIDLDRLRQATARAAEYGGRVHPHSLVDDLRWALRELTAAHAGPEPGGEAKETGREVRAARPPAGWPA